MDLIANERGALSLKVILSGTVCVEIKNDKAAIDFMGSFYRSSGSSEKINQVIVLCKIVTSRNI